MNLAYIETKVIKIHTRFILKKNTITPNCPFLTIKTNSLVIRFIIMGQRGKISIAQSG